MSRDDETKLRDPHREERDLRDGTPALLETARTSRNNDQAIGGEAIAQSAAPFAKSLGATSSTEEPPGNG